MIYKKNGEKVLSDELFRNPTSEYRGTPFWSWNCKMTPELLTKQIDLLKEMGFGGFHMHSRDGMNNPYMSEEFLSLIRACVEKAKKEDMLAWLYDEDRWPSGSAGGKVTVNPRFRQRRITIAPADRVKTGKDRKEILDPLVDLSNELPFKQAVENGKPYFIGAYDVQLDENGYLVSYSRINRTAKASYRKYFVFCEPEKPSDWYNDSTYIDILNGDAVKEFMKITHEAYKAAVGEEFDKTIPAIFTDEPQYRFSENLRFAGRDGLGLIAWTPSLPDSYKKKYGDDITDLIPELFWDLAGGAASQTRYRFHDHLCSLFSAAFFTQIGKWCDKNNLPLTGHVNAEQSLYAQTCCVGEAMRAYKGFGIPGIDMLCNWTEFSTAKQCQSVVRQENKQAMLSELYGVTGWDFDFRGHKFQGDWQAALGVTVRVPHLSWVSMKGDAKRDYPASIFYQSPWYKEYPYVEDHFARLNTALTRGKPVCSIGVIHPIESFWLDWGANDTSMAERDRKEKQFDDIINWLLFSQLDFDFIAESLLPGQCKSPSAPLAVGKMKYSAVVVPPVDTLRSTTLERLNAFVDAGGKLIFMGNCPTLVDGKASDEVKALYEKATVIPFDRTSLMGALSAERRLEIRDASGSMTGNYIYQLRQDGKYKWLFICNAKHYNLADVAPGKKIFIKIKGEFTPVLYDTISGEIKEISYVVKNGYTHIERTAYLHDSFLFRLEKAAKKKAVVNEKEYEVLSSVDFKGRVPYRRSEPNVVVLDIAEYTYDTGHAFLPAEEIRIINQKVRELVGIPRKSRTQAWVLPDEKPEHTVTLRYSFTSEIELSGAKLALEDADVSLIHFDGMEVSNHTDGYFTDEDIKTVPLPDFGKGKHTITITLPLSRKSNIENSFLLGEFNVRVEGCEKTIYAPTATIGFGSVVEQGMPFYGANVSYDCEVDVPEDGAMLKIHSSFYRGALISVDVDGIKQGKIVYAPYDLITKPLKKGKHVVTFTLFGNRHNCFSALHNAELDLGWLGPNMYTTTGDRFTYQYELKPMGILGSPVISLVKEK